MLVNNSWLLLAIIAVFAVFVQSDYQPYVVPDDMLPYVFYDKCYRPDTGKPNEAIAQQNLISNEGSNKIKANLAGTTLTKKKPGKRTKKNSNGNQGKGPKRNSNGNQGKGPKRNSNGELITSMVVHKLSTS
ncbi:unnamed protein product [Schistosoma haematobium]|nr:unnamed protein product [Schistosoma haematobium]